MLGGPPPISSRQLYHVPPRIDRLLLDSLRYLRITHPLRPLLVEWSSIQNSGRARAAWCSKLPACCCRLAGRWEGPPHRSSGEWVSSSRVFTSACYFSPLMFFNDNSRCYIWCMGIDMWCRCDCPMFTACRSTHPPADTAASSQRCPPHGQCKQAKQSTFFEALEHPSSVCRCWVLAEVLGSGSSRLQKGASQSGR